MSNRCFYRCACSTEFDRIPRNARWFGTGDLAQGFYWECGNCLSTLFVHVPNPGTVNLLLDALKEVTDCLERNYEPTPLDGRGALIRKMRAIIHRILVPS